jgi:hypothetical protein
MFSYISSPDTPLPKWFVACLRAACVLGWRLGEAMATSQGLI